MKTIRTIIATLSAVLLTFALVAWFSVRRNAAFIQRTIYQGFDQTFVVALVMGCAFLLIAIILTVAILSTDDEDEEEEEEPVRPRKRPQSAADRRPASDEQPYRRVTRTRTMDQNKPARGTDESFVRPRPKAEEKPAPKKRAQAAERPDEIAIRRAEPSAKPRKKAAQPLPEKETAEAPEKMAPAPQPEVQPEAPEAEAPVKAPAEEPVKAPAETAAEAPAEAPAKAPEPEKAPEAVQEEGTVRCIFCGGQMSRNSQVCPHCGKKR